MVDYVLESPHPYYCVCMSTCSEISTVIFARVVFVRIRPTYRCFPLFHGVLPLLAAEIFARAVFVCVQPLFSGRGTLLPMAFQQL